MRKNIDHEDFSQSLKNKFFNVEEKKNHEKHLFLEISFLFIVFHFRLIFQVSETEENSIVRKIKQITSK